MEYHKTWSATRREIPQDVKCHETYHVRTWRPVQVGLMRKTTRNNNEHALSKPHTVHAEVHVLSKSRINISHSSNGAATCHFFVRSARARAPNNKIVLSSSRDTLI